MGLRRGCRLVVARLALQGELGLQVFKYVAQLVENTITFLLVLTNRISAGNAPLALPRGRVGVAGGAGEIIFFPAEGCQALGGVAATLLPNAANAISGGGKDYAEATIKNQVFDGQKLDNKDFSGADAVDASFKKASLRGARFFKSDCERADFTGADLTGASFESANLKDAILSGAKAEGTAFSQTILDAKSISGADFTEAVVQPYVQKELCKRATGATAESLFCP